MAKKTYFVIPARKGSKGFPKKNRKLLDFTINNIPKKNHEKVIVTTDDQYIIEKIKSTKIKILNRNKKLSKDTTSIKNVMIDVVKKFEMDPDDKIVMLYLTSPKRKFSDIKKILNYYERRKIKSLTCCIEIKSNPFLCFFQLKNNKGQQIIKHDLYRRQDYPKCFEMRHFVVIFKVDEISKLNNNMYNENTTFYKIKDDIDVDYENDLKKFLKEIQ
jgi:CMP-N-acetylneuraminic acid synthetase